MLLLSLIQTAPGQDQLTFTILAKQLLSACFCNSVLSQSQSVPVIPLRGMRAEATKV